MAAMSPDGEEQKLYVVSVCSMERIEQGITIQTETKWLGMQDSGANVNLGPYWLAKIGTTKTSGVLQILWWIFPGDIWVR